MSTAATDLLHIGEILDEVQVEEKHPNQPNRLSIIAASADEVARLYERYPNGVFNIDRGGRNATHTTFRLPVGRYMLEVFHVANH